MIGGTPAEEPEKKKKKEEPKAGNILDKLAGEIDISISKIKFK